MKKFNNLFSLYSEIILNTWFFGQNISLLLISAKLTTKPFVRESALRLDKSLSTLTLPFLEGKAKVPCHWRCSGWSPPLPYGCSTLQKGLEPWAVLTEDEDFKALVTIKITQRVPPWDSELVSWGGVPVQMMPHVALPGTSVSSAALKDPQLLSHPRFCWSFPPSPRCRFLGPAHSLSSVNFEFVFCWHLPWPCLGS